MDLERYYELRAILQQWRMRLAESIRQRIEATHHWLDRLRAIYDSEGVGEEFTLWLDRWCRQAAIQFILRVLFLRVLEDRELLGVTRIRDTDGQKMWAQLTRNLGAASYVQWCCWDAAHLLPDLFGPTDYDLVLPDDDLVQRFLDDVWRRPEPDRPGWLRFDFRPDPERSDEGFQTRFIGDLYQELDAEIRERYALLQTPHFISQFILEHTLLKRFGEKDFRQVTLIDPTCGSGHFLVDAFWMFVDRYEEAAGRSREQLSSEERAQIARTIIEQHLFGCDINPYATALARFRLALAACDYAQPTSLRDFRDLRFNLVTIDSLIPYEKLMVGGVQAGSTTAKVLGQPEAIQRALPVLRRRYDAVVGNPPYIQASDPTKRDMYRTLYEAAYRSFNLSAPFTERFLQLSSDSGLVGIIESNAFARAQFGKRLIEDVLPRFDLWAIVDLAGVRIPGHGTPTLTLFARNKTPQAKNIKVVSCIRRQPTSMDPSDDPVWRDIVQNFEKDQAETSNVMVAPRPRSEMSRHPWTLEVETARLLEKLKSGEGMMLGGLCALNGRDAHTGMNEVYLGSADWLRRIGVPAMWTKPVLNGEYLRDWTITALEYALFPYQVEGMTLRPRVLNKDSPVGKYLLSQSAHLKSRKNYEQSIEDMPVEWYEYTYTARRDWSIVASPAYAFISTHTHCVWIGFSAISTQTSPRIISNLTSGTNELLLGLFNTSLMTFYLRQVSFPRGVEKDPVRKRYNFNATGVNDFKIPLEFQKPTSLSKSFLRLVNAMIDLSSQARSLSLSKLFELDSEAYHTWNSALDGYVAPHPALYPEPVEGFSTARELRAARDKLIALRQDIRGRMIFLQEEMDWLAYEMYGLLKSKAPLAEAYLSRADYEAARLELGQRPFEIAGKGYKGDWSKRYQPDPLPESLRPLTEARIAVMEANPDIALLEDPLYKRRWVPPDYDKEFREAAEWWLAEKLEWALEQHGRPISLRQWARSLGRDERVNATLEVLTGTPMFDLEEELLKIIRANAVPNCPEHYLKPSGLRKLYASRNTPQFSRKDFSDGTAWKLRGKLNIPRERFIVYTEFDHTLRGAEVPDTGGLWFGWAGWDTGQRADALAFLLDRANRAGWALRWQQCGLRAALRDLLPELELPAAERAEFEAIATMCGMGLGTSCYCQAYRDGIARGDPGVPGVGAEALGVKVLPVEGKRPRRGRKKTGDEAKQMRLDLKG